MTSSIAASAIVHANVSLGDGCRIEDFVILGVPPAGAAAGELAVAIGARATIRSHTVIYAGSAIGDGFQAGHGALIREANEIGTDVSIGSHSIVEHHVRIGNGVRIHSNAFIPEYSVLEDLAWVGPCVVFTNALYPRSPAVKHDLRGPVLRRGAKIGAGAVLLPGVVIGRDALVGAGAVVTRDVPDGAVIAGNPARVINEISAIDAYRVTEGS